MAVVGRFHFIRGDGNEESPLLPKAAVRIRAVKVGFQARLCENGVLEFRGLM